MSSASRYLCGIDIGGTFTDCAIVDDRGRITTAKVPSTPANPAEAFVAALASGADALGITLAELLGSAEQVMHGTTVATNIVVQRRGAKVGLLATVGHGEAILHMRGTGRTVGVTVDRMLDIPASNKPEPLVPRALIREVVERVDCDGDVVVQLDEASAERAIRELVDAGVEAIAICFLWSFTNPAHERRVKELVEQLAPGVYVTASSDVAPVWGEYERTVATVLNSYVGPATQTYLDDVTRRIREAGFDRDVMIVECTGGVVPAPLAGKEALFTLGSGPVAGIMGSAYLAAEIGIRDVIAVDMGGTSFDIGLVRDGRPVTTDISVVDQYQYFVPAVDVRSIGAGGGSIAGVDEVSGGLLVGPESAGAVPGPACYSRGGTRATVTDADLLLGYLDPEFFLGGRMTLDRELAEKAVAGVAAAVGMSPVATAAGIVKVVEFAMADLIRKVTIERGFDPRDFALFIYGGAGAVHGVVLAQELGIKKVVVPMGTAAGVWSALGAASANVVHVYRVSNPQSAPFDVEQLNAVYGQLETQARAELLEQGFDASLVTVERHASLRHHYQIHEVEVPVAGGTIDEAGAAQVIADFEAAYEALYGKGSGYSAAGFELTILKVVATGSLWKPELSGTAVGGVGEAATRGTRRIYSPAAEDFVDAEVFRGVALPAGTVVVGPGLVELPWTTVVVHAGSRAETDSLGNLIITLDGKDS